MLQFPSVLSRPLSLATLLLLLSQSAAASERTVLRDDFSDAASGWMNRAATRASDAGFAVYTDTGQYQMTPVQDETYGLVSAPRQARSGNVAVAADLFLYAGVGKGAGGLACRAQDLNNFYAFVARGDGGLVIAKIQNGQPTVLAEGRIEQVMPGAVDTRLSVRCEGDTLSVAATGGSRIEATDSTFAGGETGLLVLGEKLAGTSASFDEFELSEIDG